MIWETHKQTCKCSFLLHGYLAFWQTYEINKSICCCRKSLSTSPPSARVVAMRSMQQQNCINKTPLKHSWKLLKLYLKFSRNTLDTIFKHPWNFLKTSLKLPWNTLWTSFRYPWTSLELPLKVSRNTNQSSLKHPKNLKNSWSNFETSLTPRLNFF